MITISAKKFCAYDACCTSGEDKSKMKAIYQVVDTDGFHYTAYIAATTHDSGNNDLINTAIQEAIG